MLDYTPALNNNLNVDDTTTTFAGVLNGRYKVYVDPYAANVAASQYYVAGYKGTSPYDAGMFYCPYVPLQMVRAVGEHTFQPKIGFKTRYGIVGNPFHTGTVVFLLRVRSPLLQILTSITEELKSQTSCNQYNIISVNLRGRKTPFFFD